MYFILIYPSGLGLIIKFSLVILLVILLELHRTSSQCFLILRNNSTQKGSYIFFGTSFIFIFIFCYST